MQRRLVAMMPMRHKSKRFPGKNCRFFEDARPLFSVTMQQTRYWDSSAHALDHSPDILLPTQDLPPIYEETSCACIFERKILIKKHNRRREGRSKCLRCL